jgi:hypothetical protein
MTSPPNAFADGIDVVAMEPGESKTSVWGVHCTSAPSPKTDNPED